MYVKRQETQIPKGCQFFELLKSQIAGKLCTENESCEVAILHCYSERLKFTQRVHKPYNE